MPYVLSLFLNLIYVFNESMSAILVIFPKFINNTNKFICSRNATITDHRPTKNTQLQEHRQKQTRIHRVSYIKAHVFGILLKLSRKIYKHHCFLKYGIFFEQGIHKRTENM